MGAQSAYSVPVTEAVFNEATAEGPSESQSDKELLKSAFEVFKTSCDVFLPYLFLPRP